MNFRNARGPARLFKSNLKNLTPSGLAKSKPLSSCHQLQRLSAFLSSLAPPSRGSSPQDLQRVGCGPLPCANSERASAVWGSVTVLGADRVLSRDSGARKPFLRAPEGPRWQLAQLIEEIVLMSCRTETMGVERVVYFLKKSAFLRPDIHLNEMSHSGRVSLDILHPINIAPNFGLVGFFRRLIIVGSGAASSLKSECYMVYLEFDQEILVPLAGGNMQKNHRLRARPLLEYLSELGREEKSFLDEPKVVKCTFKSSG